MPLGRAVEAAAEELLAIRVRDEDSGKQQQQEHGLSACPAQVLVADLPGEPDFLPGVTARLKQPTKPATKKPTSPRKPKTRLRKPNQGEISERAYFIHLEEGESDELRNWLRAERELTTA